MKLAIWSTSTPRDNSTHPEMFRRQLEKVELADRIGIDQIWFFEHHLISTGLVPSPNLLIAAASRTTSRIRFASMVTTSGRSAIHCSSRRRPRCSTT
jgi:alkanesulfonate monooxygenase SsuD/methylene tetrahydromethanopterin reductase-like flavin-dependent oxidoreductase (luciferase family)